MPKQWLKGPLDNLAALISESAAFRTMVGAASAAIALNSIYRAETSQRPLAITAVTSAGVGASALQVQGDLRTIAKVGGRLRVLGSTGNDATYQVRAAATLAGGFTTIPVEEAVPSATVDGELQLQWLPRCIIGSRGGRVHTRRSVSDWNTAGGGLWALFEQATPSTYWDPATGLDDPSAAHDAFLGTIQSIVDQLQDLQGTSGLLAVGAMSEETPALEVDPDENGGTPYWWIVIGFQGPTGGGGGG